MKIFTMKDLGELHWLMNLKIEWNRTSKLISFSQEGYIDKMLSCLHLEDLKTHTTPIPPNIQLSKDQCSSTDEEKVAMSKIPYREAIGSLMWTTVSTQPDITIAVSLLSQFLENPGEVHWKAVKRVVWYLNGMKNYKLFLRNNHNSLIGYADANWASQDHRHSISAYIFQINGGNISWSCQMQIIVTLSSTEAEFIVLTHVTK